MRITFVSNYINHHQLPFCNAMSEIGDDVEFFFIQTIPMEEKRLNMGWGFDDKAFPFVVRYYEEEERAKDLILNSDVVLFGWTEDRIWDVEQKRLSSGKLSFRVSERIYREGQWKFISPRGLMKKYNEHFKFRNKPVYLLCTGAYVASDFSLIKSFPGKMLKWGYFPDAAGSEAVAQRGGYKKRLCWAGRLIDLKHPEFAVKVAAALKAAGFDFTMDIVGDGPLKGRLTDMVKELGLETKVNLTGGKTPEEVLSYMRGADIFLFTSNYLEGWGAVVNEAMQSGCAVVASNEAGAVPFLIEDGKNGLIYKDGSYEDFEHKVRFLLDHPDMIKPMGTAAMETINNKWNAKNAAAELIRFCRELESGKTPVATDNGPMSPAAVLTPPGFSRTLKEKNHLE
ncbi:glycosyltransferase family 4 protein [Butyrivibrio sp. FCS006]|uniref:glycosyltransferase family 4 protein n=1 Tax=Butyrivibrio sp. FCS006 TaxID=1280684 RepID=UPI0003FDEA19|nr:glycosyltransferase family 4 protein [Butyrivibrio sp. FCS006]